MTGVQTCALPICKDAFEGLRTVDPLMQGKRDGNLDPEFGRAEGGRRLPARANAQAAAEEVEVPARSEVATDVPVFTPPFLGSRVAKGIALDEIAAYINETALFRNQWQFRPEVRDGHHEATLYFFGFPGEDAELELTWNTDGRSYELGTAYGHVAIRVDDMAGALAGLAGHGIHPEREPYQVRAGGNLICFVQDPDGYRVELIERAP